MTEEVLALLADFRTTQDYFVKARILHHVTKDKGVRIKDVAKELGMKESYVCHILRLNRIPELVADGFYAKSVTVSHLFVLSRLRAEQDMVEIYERILADTLTVGQTEELVRKRLFGIETEGKYLAPLEAERLVEEVYAVSEGKAKLIQTRVKTKLVIEWTGSCKERLAKVTAYAQRFRKKESL